MFRATVRTVFGWLVFKLCSHMGMEMVYLSVIATSLPPTNSANSKDCLSERVLGFRVGSGVFETLSPTPEFQGSPYLVFGRPRTSQPQEPPLDNGVLECFVHRLGFRE